MTRDQAIIMTCILSAIFGSLIVVNYNIRELIKVVKNDN